MPRPVVRPARPRSVFRDFRAARPRGPKPLQASQLGVFRAAVSVPEPPPGWPGSEPEWRCYWALEQEGLREPWDFTYQSAFEGGRLFYGGLVLDFVLPHHQLALNVQGDWAHYSSSPKVQRSRDQAYRVAQYGLRLIFLDADDLAVNPRYFVREALAGRDHSRTLQGP